MASLSLGTALIGCSVMKNILRGVDPALAEESYRATPDENEEEDSIH